MIFFGLVHMAFSHSLVFISNYFVYLSARFLVGGSAHCLFAILSISALEVVPIHKRATTMCVLQIGWNVGYTLLALLAYNLRSAADLQVLPV
jgi:predicted MFS family arabinose efflux permease